MAEPSPLLPINYGHAKPSRPRIPPMVPLAAWVLMVLFLSIFAVPKFEIIFRDFKAQLPPLTQAMIVLSHIIGKYFGWVLLLPVPFVLPKLATKFFDSGDPTEKRAPGFFGKPMDWIIVLIFVFTLLFILAGIFLGMMTLGASGGISSGILEMNDVLTPDQIADLAGISQICGELGADLVVIGATSLLILMGDLGRFTRDVDLTVALV